MDSEGDAYGDLYLDDGESLIQEKTAFITVCLPWSSCLLIGLTTPQLEATNSHLNVSRKGQWTSSEPLSSVIILGVSKKPRQITLGQTQLDKWSWGEKAQILRMTGLEGATEGGVWGKEWELSWK